MNFNITLPERMILESLQQSSKTLKEINECTKLDPLFLKNIVPSLVSKNLICTCQNNKYGFNKNINADIKSELKNHTSLKSELSEIVSSSIRDRLDNSNQEAFKLKKVFLTPREQKIFKGLLYNVETFLESAESKEHNTSDETIFFWGENNYGKVTHNILNY